jgi:outer membrane protein OmpA-like peptidoglycan-associated protein
VRGNLPYAVRTQFQNALESVHLQFGRELEAFTGDSAVFERARPILETCLVTEFRRPARAGSYRRWVIAASVVLLAVGVWAGLAVRDQRRWTAYLERLRAEPGIVVLASDRRFGKFFVAGLRDPLARDPATLVASTGLGPESVESRWEPYQSLYPDFVTARARDLLRPPASVTLAYDNGALTASGEAPERWIVDSERIAPAIAGVRRFAYTGTPPDLQLKNRLQEMTLLFPKGQSRIAPGQVRTIRRIDAVLAALNDAVRAGNRRAAVELLGFTDTDGTDLENGPLSQARADAVLATLQTSTLDALDFTARGVGSAASRPAGVTASTTEAEKERNRRVSFRVILPDGAAPGGRRP